MSLADWIAWLCVAALVGLVLRALHVDRKERQRDAELLGMCGRACRRRKVRWLR